MRKVTLAGVAASILALSFLPVAPAVAASAPGVLVATGTVTGTAGQLVTGGVVDLYAWPSDQVLQNTATGAAVPRTLLATTTASASGAFSLSVAPGALQAAAVSSGNANLEADSGSASWFFVVNTADPVAANIQLRNKASATADDPQQKCATASWNYQHQLDRDWATVGQGYIWNSATGATMGFSYGMGQSSTLGIGVSSTSPYGGFSASGTESTSSNSLQVFPTEGPAYILWRTQFRTALYQKICQLATYYQARSNGWAGGDNLVSVSSAPNAPQCVPELAGGEWHTSNAQAKTWTGSFGLSMGDVGFNGSAVTGYDSNAEVIFKFSQNRIICGSDNIPASASQLVVKPGPG